MFSTNEVEWLLAKERAEKLKLLKIKTARKHGLDYYDNLRTVDMHEGKLGIWDNEDWL